MHTYINKWRPIEIAVLLALAVTLLVGAASLHRQDGLQEKMIRLHVIANSDSEDDQTLTDDHAEETVKKVLAALERKFGASIR